MTKTTRAPGALSPFEIGRRTFLDGFARDVVESLFGEGTPEAAEAERGYEDAVENRARFGDSRPGVNFGRRRARRADPARLFEHSPFDPRSGWSV